MVCLESEACRVHLVHKVTPERMVSKERLVCPAQRASKVARVIWALSAVEDHVVGEARLDLLDHQAKRVPPA